jgi:hypothetical protein
MKHYDYNIRENTMRHTKGQSYYAVIQNPMVDYHDRKVIYGSTPEIVERKIKRQLGKWGVIKEVK